MCAISAMKIYIYLFCMFVDWNMELDFLQRINGNKSDFWVVVTRPLQTLTSFSRIGSSRSNVYDVTISPVLSLIRNLARSLPDFSKL